MERFIAFVLIGVVFCLGYPKHRPIVILMAIGLAGLLEALQHLVPSRHSQVHDFVAIGFGALTGALVASGLLMVSDSKTKSHCSEPIATRRTRRHRVTARSAGL